MAGDTFLTCSYFNRFTGDRWDPVPTGTGGHTYVRGARILTAAIEFLLHELNMGACSLVSDRSVRGSHLFNH